MSFYLYCLAYPMEALVASMLPPEEFAAYMAVGTKKISRGKVVFLEVSPDLSSEHFDIARAREACVPHPNGRPKNSVYLSIYRVLERLPLTSLGALHLVTRDGRDLAILPQRVGVHSDRPRREGAYLYQELCPVRPLVASCLDAQDFGQVLTDTTLPVHVPRLLYARLNLGQDPFQLAQEASLPYDNLPHVENCLRDVVDAKKAAKTVERAPEDFFYRAVMEGLYLAESGAQLYYPFPTEADLKDRHYAWWRSAV